MEDWFAAWKDLLAVSLLPYSWQVPSGATTIMGIPPAPSIYFARNKGITWCHKEVLNNYMQPCLLGNSTRRIKVLRGVLGAHLLNLTHWKPRANVVMIYKRHLRACTIPFGNTRKHRVKHDDFFQLAANWSTTWYCNLKQHLHLHLQSRIRPEPPIRPILQTRSITYNFAYKILQLSTFNPQFPTFLWTTTWIFCSRRSTRATAKDVKSLN